MAKLPVPIESLTIASSVTPAAEACAVVKAQAGVGII